MYVNACPWCHRVAAHDRAARAARPVRVVQMTDDAERASRGGWVFESAAPDPVFGARDLREVYDGVSGGAYGGGARRLCWWTKKIDAR